MKQLMNSFALICAICLSFNLSSQSLNYWVGGQPGAETAWDNPNNWSQHQIPDWTQGVVIPNTESRGNFYPIIKNEIEPIAYLEIRNGAKIKVTSLGKLIIDGDATYNYGIFLVGTIFNAGEIEVENTGMDKIYIQNGRLVNEKPADLASIKF